MAQSSPKLMWDEPKVAKMYSSVESITGHFARKLIQQTHIVDHPQHEDLAVFDNACGTGIVTVELQQALKHRAPKTFSISCGDFADAMVDATQQRIQTAGWSNVTAAKVNAQDTKLPSNHFDYYLTNFGPMVFPDPDAMFAECHRALVPGGTCAFTTWKHVGWTTDVRAAYNTIPDLPPFPSDLGLQGMFNGGRWDDASYLRDVVEKHGFVDVQITDADTTQTVRTLDEFCAMLPMIVGQITNNFWTEAQRQQHGGPQFLKVFDKWYEDKYGEGPIEWAWGAFMTTCKKPM